MLDLRRAALSSNQVYPVIWHNDSVLLIDQTRLPNEYTFVEIHRSQDMARAIKTMIVRGTPVIGVAAAYAMLYKAFVYFIRVKNAILLGVNVKRSAR